MGMHFVYEEAPFYDDEEFLADLIGSLSAMVLVWATTPDRRRQVLAFLQSMNAEGEAQSAASMAALLGGSDASKSLKLAKERFRSLSFDSFTEEDFLKNRETEGSENAMFKKTKHVKLGHCDAFLSHSWSDDGVLKYAALKRWAAAFKRENGREPEVWLDKACIDQTDIEHDLLCLPIFTSGCQNLLIFAGKTYTSRLWCIIEVFVFLKMGGGMDRITVLPIGMSEADAKAKFQEIDASEAKCFLEGDRQKLLAIVESGFGNFVQFNSILRHVFMRRVTALPNSFQSRKQASVRNLFSSRKLASIRPTVRSTESGLVGVEEN